MEANDRQKEVIDACIAELAFWRDNNDISSPTNLKEVETSIESLNLKGYQETSIVNALHDLWFTIINIKTDETPD